MDDQQEPSRAAHRLAAALGWHEIPEFTAEEIREADEQFEAAQAEARRIYGVDKELAGPPTGSEATARAPRPHDEAAALRDEVSALREPVTWLCRAMQVLLDHHHIHLDPPEDWREREERALQQIQAAAGRAPTEAELAKVAEIESAYLQSRGGCQAGYDTQAP